MDIATIMKQLHLFRASSANILNYFLPMTDKPVNQIKFTGKHKHPPGTTKSVPRARIWLRAGVCDRNNVTE